MSLVDGGPAEREPEHDPAAELIRGASLAADRELDLARLRTAVEVRSGQARTTSVRRGGTAAIIAAVAAVAVIALGTPEASQLFGHHRLPLGAASGPASAPTTPPTTAAPHGARATARAVLAALRTTGDSYCIAFPTAQAGAAHSIIAKADGKHFTLVRTVDSCQPLDGARPPTARALIPGKFPLDLVSPLSHGLDDRGHRLWLKGDVLLVPWVGGAAGYTIDRKTFLPSRVQLWDGDGRRLLDSGVTWLASSTDPGGGPTSMP